MFRKHKFKIISAILMAGLIFANSGALVEKGSKVVKELPPTKVYKKFLADNTVLTGLTLKAGTTEIKTYSEPLLPSNPVERLASTDNSITVVPVCNSGGTITVNGVSVASGSNFNITNLVSGETKITVVVTSGKKSNTYNFSVYRPSNDANLTSLSLSSGTLTPSFSANTTTYNSEVENQIDKITINAAANLKATIKVNGTVSNGNPVESALKVGSNTISIEVQAEDGSTKTYTVNVTRKPIPVTSINLGSTSETLAVNGELQLSAEIVPNDATYKTIIWSSTNDQIASVKDGLVKALSKGTAIITAVNPESGIKAECRITVVVPVEGISLPSSMTLKLYQSTDIIPIISPSESSNPKVTWSSDKPSVVDVVSGKLTANAVGTAKIIVTTEDGAKTASCDITVVEPQITGLTLSKAPTEEGKPFTLTSTFTTTGSVNPLVYQVWVEDKDGWRLAKNFDAGNPITNNTDNTVITKYDFTIAGENLTVDNQYKVFVRIKDSVTGYVYDQKTEMATCVGPQLRLDKIIANTKIEGQANVGERVEITAYGAEIVDYQFSVSNGFTWEVIRSYNTSNTYTWTPSKAGNYIIRVSARGSESSQSKEMSMPFDVLANAADGTPNGYEYVELDGVTIPTALTVNNPFTLKAMGKGGDNTTQLQYRFTIGEAMRTSSTLQDYKSDSSVEWKPTSPGIYEIFTYIKDSDSTSYEDAIRRYCTVKRADNTAVRISNVVKNYPENKSYALGNTFNFDVTATGSDNIQYSFWRLEDKGYRLIKDYGSKSGTESENQFNWTPTKPGTYTILVRVKDKASGSYEDERSYTYIITDSRTSGIRIDSLGINGTRAKRTNHVITANAVNTSSGQTSDTLLYMFVVIDDNFGWRTLQGFTPKNTCNWLPKKAGTYKVLVWVKDNVSGSYEKQMVQTVTIQ